MTVLQLPRLEDVPAITQYSQGTHNYDMDKHTRLIYHPITGIVYKRRFVLAMEMLAACCGSQTQCILEVGYGAGLLFSTLSRMSREVIGVDVIDARAAVAIRGMLCKLGVDNVRLLQGSLLALPLNADSVDAVLCLSVLEHLHRGEEMEKAAREMVRVLRPGGVAILGFPVKNKITRALFRVIGYDDDVIHPSSHADILACYLHQQFQLESERRFPAFLPLDLGLYEVVQMRKRSGQAVPPRGA
jgi:SAM-dependent methyltransferase